MRSAFSYCADNLKIFRESGDQGLVAVMLLVPSRHPERRLPRPRPTRGLLLPFFIAFSGCLGPIVGEEQARSNGGAPGLDAGAPLDLGEQEAGEPRLDGPAIVADAEAADSTATSLDALAPDSITAFDAQREAGPDSGKRPFDGAAEHPTTEIPDAAVSTITDSGKRGEAGAARDGVSAQPDSPVAPDAAIAPDVPVASPDEARDLVLPGPERPPVEAGPESSSMAPDTPKLDVPVAPPDLAPVSLDTAPDVSADLDPGVAIDTRPRPGRLIVIGHDFAAREPTAGKILGNAVLFKTTNPVVVAAYQGAASPTSVDNANSAIEATAASNGQTVEWNNVGAAKDVPDALTNADVFLVYGQQDANDSDLKAWAAQWKASLATFIGDGKAIVLLDGYYTKNGGTCEIATLAGLLGIAPHHGAAGLTCEVVAATDVIVAGLPSAYVCPTDSVRFSLSEEGPNVTTIVAAGDPVIVEKQF
jgi:hypothetical protein